MRASEKRCSQLGTKLGVPLSGVPLFHSPACHRVQRHPFERIATPFQVYSWTAPQAEHAMDCVRAEDAYTSRLGYEEHIPGQVQPRPALPARLLCFSQWAPTDVWGLSTGKCRKGIAQSRSAHIG